MGEGAAEGMGKNGSARGHGKGAVPRKRDDVSTVFPPDRRCAFPCCSPQVQKHLILQKLNHPLNPQNFNIIHIIFSLIHTYLYSKMYTFSTKKHVFWGVCQDKSKYNAFKEYCLCAHVRIGVHVRVRVCVCMRETSNPILWMLQNKD